MTVVDADAHINENVADWTSLHAAHPGWIGVTESGGKQVAQIDGRPYPLQEGRGRGVPIDASTHPLGAEGARDVQARLRDMDAEGIDVQVIYGGMVIGLTSYSDPGFALDFARAYNDWLIDDVCSVQPDRLKAVAAVPLQSVERSIAELHRAVAKGAVAVTIPPALGAPTAPDSPMTLDHPSLRPFFAAAAEAGVAVGVHGAPGMHVPVPAADLFDNYAMVHSLSFPIDQMVAFTALAMGGVLDEFPTLRVAFLESGVGWVPFAVYRMEEHREKLQGMIPGMTSSPQEMIERGQVYFSFECEEQLLDVYVEHLGADSIIFASDYPHWDADLPGTVAKARETRARSVTPTPRRRSGSTRCGSTGCNAPPGRARAPGTARPTRPALRTPRVDRRRAGSRPAP